VACARALRHTGRAAAGYLYAVAASIGTSNAAAAKDFRLRQCESEVAEELDLCVHAGCYENSRIHRINAACKFCVN